MRPRDRFGVVEMRTVLCRTEHHAVTRAVLLRCLFEKSHVMMRDISDAAPYFIEHLKRGIGS